MSYVLSTFKARDSLIFCKHSQLHPPPNLASFCFWIINQGCVTRSDQLYVKVYFRDVAESFCRGKGTDFNYKCYIHLISHVLQDCARNKFKLYMAATRKDELYSPSINDGIGERRINQSNFICKASFLWVSTSKSFTEDG